MSQSDYKKKLKKPYMRGAYYYDDVRLKALGEKVLDDLRKSGVTVGKESNLTPEIEKLSEAQRNGPVSSTFSRILKQFLGLQGGYSRSKETIMGISPYIVTEESKSACGKWDRSLQSAKYPDLTIALNIFHEGSHTADEVLKLPSSEKRADVAAALALKSMDPGNPRVAGAIKAESLYQSMNTHQTVGDGVPPHLSMGLIDNLDRIIAEQGISMKKPLHIVEATRLAETIIQKYPNLIPRGVSPDTAAQAKIDFCSTDPEQRPIDPVEASTKKKVDDPPVKKSGPARPLP